MAGTSTAKAWVAVSSISLLGSWAQIVAMPAAAIDAGGGPISAGLVTAASFAAGCVAVLFGGVSADRFAVWKILAVTQLLLAGIVATLAGTVAVGQATPLLLTLFAFTIGLVGAVNGPAAQRHLSNLADETYVAKWVGVLSVSGALARVVAVTADGGAVRYGAAAVFAANALTFAFVALWVLIRRSDHRQPRPTCQRRQRGLRSVWSAAPRSWWTLLTWVLIVNIVARHHQLLFVLDDGKRASYALLSGAFAVGSVAGAAAATRWWTVTGQVGMIGAGAAAFAQLLMLTGAIVPAVAVIGAAVVAADTAARQATLQVFGVDAHGRASAVEAVARGGGAALGGVVLGAAVSVIGWELTVVAGSLAGFATMWMLNDRITERHDTSAVATTRPRPSSSTADR